MKTMNSYNVFNENNYSEVLFHAIAANEDQVIELAEEQGISLEGLTIELDRTNVKDQLGRPFSARIEDARVD